MNWNLVHFEPMWLPCRWRNGGRVSRELAE